MLTLFFQSSFLKDGGGHKSVGCIPLFHFYGCLLLRRCCVELAVARPHWPTSYQKEETRDKHANSALKCPNCHESKGLSVASSLPQSLSWIVSCRKGCVSDRISGASKMSREYRENMLLQLLGTFLSSRLQVLVDISGPNKNIWAPPPRHTSKPGCAPPRPPFSRRTPPPFPRPQNRRNNFKISEMSDSNSYPQ